jgi:hypothetical protein
MPSFTPDDIDIDVSEFYSSCSYREITELIHMLKEDGYFPKVTEFGFDDPGSPTDIYWKEMIMKLVSLRLRLTNEDENTIKEIISKY